MQEAKSTQSEKASVEDKAVGDRLSRISRLLSLRAILRTFAVLLVCALVVGAWWFFPRSLSLNTPLAPGESYTVGTIVVLDNDTVGTISALRATGGSSIAEIKLTGLTSGQKKKLRDGLVRVSGMRMVWLTSEFIDLSGPPLIDDDTVPAISRAERDNRNILASFYSWIVPGSGVGLLWLLWRGAKRLLS